MTRGERAAAVLLLAGAALPFWAGRFLPLLDLPQHLGLAAVIARAGDPASPFGRYYLLDGGVTPYWGYYGAMWLLTRALPVELASRVLLSAYAAGLPLAAAYLLRSFGRDARWAAFALPLVWSTNLFLGFATFLLSLPLFLLALGLVERHLAAERTGAARSLAVALAAALVFLCHAQAYLLLGLGALVLLAAHARGPRWLAARGAAFVPSLALFAAWFGPRFAAGAASVEEHTARHRTYGGLARLGAVWEPWRTVLGAAPERLFGSFTDRSDQLLGAAAGALFLAALASSWGPAPLPAPRGEAGAAPGRPRRWLLAHRCDLLAAALALAYLLAPIEISGQWYVGPRHLVFAALALPLLLARPPSGRRRWLAGGAAAAGLLLAGDAALQIRAFQRQVGDFGALARALPLGGRVLGLPFDLGAAGPVRLWPLLHFACYEQVLAGGDVGFSFAGLPSIPVRYRPGMQAPHPYEWRPEELDWAAMGAAYDAFLVSGAPRGRGGAELVRHAEPVARAGPFTLWRPRRPR
ncbi:hypothetical protein [Anaeromyxobacter diazotrophicus]|uniref:Glycosyltransferase RgtA/B/C/D-like domain-containing protein n=1 Tax=Anaeromyxobacter diazotrophicus TaxID=2590199 RepID=A0A7I9VLV9_9BACT|nr:hypothetical protein [Anaeromyxobacter diazotrophicus]GEJ57188.1 hypothetical protein AMYX_19290 [Anaeromyxobacter diazotrophicus]